MRKRRQAIVLAVLASCGLGWWAWSQWGTSDERQIRRQLHDLVAEFNGATTDGGTVARAARIGQFFTAEVVVELGKGSPPIHGRETLMGMAARLQPRTAAFEASLDDVSVEPIGADRADATFTLLIRRRGFGSDEESLDAREFAAEFLRDGGTWRITHVQAIDTFR